MKSSVWHPNTQMNEWGSFDTITKAKGIWLIDSKGNKIIDAVGSMWCNVWGHSKKELSQCDNYNSNQKRFNIHHLFNLTNDAM